MLPRLVCAVAAFVLADPAFAQDTIVVRSQEITPGVHMLSGPGGNIGLIVGADGVFMIDDQVRPATPHVLAAVRRITDRAVDFVLNTHFHFDHTGGNEALGGSGALIVAHDNVRRRLSADYFFADVNQTQRATAKQGLPVVTFSRDVTFHLNGEEVHAFHVRNAHTDGDAIVHFRKANVIHTGDVFFNGTYPYIDVGAGGSIDGTIAATNRLISLANAQTKIIPGHGPLADRAALVRTRDVLVAARAAVRAAMRGNRTLAQVQAAKPTARWDREWGNGFTSGEAFVAIIYRSLRRSAGAR